MQSSDPESCSEDGEDWYLEQEILEEDSFDLPKYGFANKTQGMGRELRVSRFIFIDLVNYFS